MVLKLKNMGFPFDGYNVYYYLENCEMFINCGIDPVEDIIFIDKEDYFS